MMKRVSEVPALSHLSGSRDDGSLLADHGVFQYRELFHRVGDRFP